MGHSTNRETPTPLPRCSRVEPLEQGSPATIASGSPALATAFLPSRRSDGGWLLGAAVARARVAEVRSNARLCHRTRRADAFTPRTTRTAIRRTPSEASFGTTALAGKRQARASRRDTFASRRVEDQREAIGARPGCPVPQAEKRRIPKKFRKTEHRSRHLSRAFRDLCLCPAVSMSERMKAW